MLFNIVKLINLKSYCVKTKDMGCNYMTETLQHIAYQNDVKVIQRLLFYGKVIM